MSYLSNELALITKKNGVIQTDVVRAGLTTGHVSRIFNGKQKYVEDADLETIISVVAKNDEERGRLVRARMMDTYTGRWADLVNVVLRSGDSKQKRRFRDKVGIDPQVSGAFDFLYNLVPTKPGIAEATIGLARIVGYKPGE